MTDRIMESLRKINQATYPKFDEAAFIKFLKGLDTVSFHRGINSLGSVSRSIFSRLNRMIGMDTFMVFDLHLGTQQLFAEKLPEFFFDSIRMAITRQQTGKLSKKALRVGIKATDHLPKIVQSSTKAPRYLQYKWFKNTTKDDQGFWCD